ncbi:CGNR zinc finger protein [Cytobacillus firmus]|uniref:CGNR zinc finger protein n=2 Tax=Cytobacillus TaxID=2675230 RepID=A0A366K158_CYTFI|nr:MULTISPECIES: CGNR zinc finger domain-containing protein [Cytobacillus]RBP94977.1 CGNR zinc finger protein [Cytobacillus firmus]TDX43818.1 CGNR zinc finger protein [Cytobacillus oceanisediminis]
MNKSLFLLGGTAWINLVNTTYNSEKQNIDILIEPSITLQWLGDNNLLRESDFLALENDELLKSLIVELRLLRDLSKTILVDLEQQGKLSLNVTEQLKRLTKQVKVRLTIVSDSDKLKLVSEGITTRDHVLYMIIHSIIQTLDTIPTHRIRNCEHPECRLYFVDTSKSGKRRWCSMELCGNRQKSAEFYARKKKK